MTQLQDYAHQTIQQKRIALSNSCLLNQDQRDFSSQTSINEHIVQQEKNYNTIPFRNYLYWNYKILLNVHSHKQFLSIESKIINPQGQVLKVISQYHRTFLYRRFLIKRTVLIPKINPSSGEISFCIHFFMNNSFSNKMQEQIMKIVVEKIHQQMPIFQQIVNLIQKNQNGQEYQQAQQTSKFVRFCGKKSQIQKKSSIKNYFQKRKEMKCRTYDGCSQIRIQKNSSIAVKQILKYLTNPLSRIQEVNESTETLFIKPESKRIMNSIQEAFIRSKSNFKTLQQVNLSNKSTQILINSIKEMKQKRQSIRTQKINESSIGCFPLQAKVQRISIVQRTYKLLSYFPSNLEFSFLNNYFKFSQFQANYDKNIIFQLAVHKQELKSFLQTNNESISFSTKLRILSQIISAAHLLQNKCSILASDLAFNNFSLTKNITIKINQIQTFQKVDQNEKLDLSPSINIKNVQNQMNIGRMYSKIFFKKDILYFKPSKNKKRLRLSQVYQDKFEQKQIIIDKLYQQCGYYGPKKLMCLLSCIFIPYIPTISYNEIKRNPTCRNLKWSISSLVKILQNIC